MKKTVKIKFLGTGANGGIPQIDCRCVNCLSKINHRKRSCILVEIKKHRLIVECGPDFHSQLIDNNLRIQDISGITISHLHWDHCSGLFDLSSGKSLNIPIMVHPELRRSLEANSNFNFIFKGGWAKFSQIDGFDITFIEIRHDPDFPTFAVRVACGGKKILIATDIWEFNKKFINAAKIADLIIFDSTFLNQNKHWHISIFESARQLSELNKNVIFTHVNHTEDLKKIEEFTKRFGFSLAFDGKEIKI